MAAPVAQVGGDWPAQVPVAHRDPAHRVLLSAVRGGCGSRFTLPGLQPARAPGPVPGPSAPGPTSPAAPPGPLLWQWDPPGAECRPQAVALETEVLPTAPQPSTEAALDGQASRYFAALDASIRGLQQRTQQLIDKVNDSRKEDHAVMSSFRESLLLKVSGLAEQVEERLFHLYGLHNEQIQERLQELAEVMERVRQAEAELRQVCRTVEAAYHDLCLQPET
uniref:Synaptonemal complex central element protein 2 n=1 Tax=Accipiter nisus TaxID=211598 RepID=A0A8B9NQ13_9AVES